MNFFEQGGNAMNPEETISGNYVHWGSEEGRKITWMREMRIRPFMLIELENCRNELRWMIRRDKCIVDNCLEEDHAIMHLPVPPDYTENLERRMRTAAKGILPPTIKMILKTQYPVSACQAPIHPQQQ